LWLILILAPAQVVIGDYHGLNTLKHQPMKVAAMEGNWETGTGVPLLLFALPDQANQQNHFEIKVPKLASLILTHDWDGEVPGLNEIAPEMQPPVFIVFWAFRVMVAMGVLMVLFGLAGLWLRRGNRYLENKPFLNGLRLMSLSPFIAVLSGWIVTETGRAPWLIYEQMTHAQGLTPSLTGGMALFTLIGYVLVYAMVFSAGVFYLMSVFRGGLETANAEQTDSDVDKAQRPISAANANLDGGL
jgi:cytochrome d ubiquinol oxidase subunit I